MAGGRFGVQGRDHTEDLDAGDHEAGQRRPHRDHQIEQELAQWVHHRRPPVHVGHHDTVQRVEQAHASREQQWQE